MVSASCTAELRLSLVCSPCHSLQACVFAVLPLGPWLFSLFTDSHWSQPCLDSGSMTPVFPRCHLLPECWPLYLLGSRNLPSDSGLTLYFPELFTKALSLLKLAKSKKEQNWNRDICVTSSSLDSGSENQRCKVVHLLFHIYLANSAPAPTSLNRFYYFPWAIL